MIRRLTVALAVLAALAGGTVALLAGSAAADQSISVKQSTLTDHECDATEWHFVINQIDTEADAPDHITVTFSNNDVIDVPLAMFTGGVAHYITTDDLDQTVTDATATIYDGWGGQFNLSHGPCNETTTTTTTTTTMPGETTTTTSPPTTPTTAPPSTPTTPTTTTTTPATTATPAAVTRVVTVQPTQTG